jgi:NADH:quinone reductase (non-electrogenic)
MKCLRDDGPISKSAKKRIVILGGGFGGVYAALHLERLLAREPEVEICLVSRDNFFLFTPMLHEIAASDLEITNIVNPLRKLLRRAKVFVGEVERIDLPNKRVLVSHGHHNSDNHSHRLDYDHLVLALGSITNFSNLPGFAELALAMKSLPDAIQLRARIIRSLEEANSECSLDDRQSLLTFVVAGGGFAGVETVAALNDFVRAALQFYPNLREWMLRIVLVHPGPVILPELGESLGRYAQKVLAQRGIEIRLNTRVTSMTESEVYLKDSPPIPSTTLIWTAGTMPNPLLSSLPCQKECGRVAGRPPKPFSFQTIGLLASIGRRTGVARIFGFNFSGFFAWWLWRTIYLSKLPGLDKKVRVAFDWTLDLLFRKDVCAVHDLSSRADFHRRERRRATVGDNGQYQRTAEVEATLEGVNS